MSNRSEIEGVRWDVLLPARLRSDGPPSPVTILNMSTSGLMISGDVPLRVGSYVEVVRRSTSIVGRVVWVKGRCAGVMSQDPIDVQRLLGSGRLKQAAELAGDPRIGRRVADQHAKSQEVADRSAQLGRMFEFAALGLAVSVFGAAIAMTAYEALNTALTPVQWALRF
jgi:hypothetical protein